MFVMWYLPGVNTFYCPLFLYKFTKIDNYFFDMILNNRIFFQSPINFNDPFDCYVNLIFDSENDEDWKYYLSRHKELFKKYGIDLENKNHLEGLKKDLSKNGLMYKLHTEEFFKKLRKESSVFCVSEKKIALSCLLDWASGFGPKGVRG